MSAVQRKAIVPTAPSAIWAFLADGDNWSQWEPDIVKVLSHGEGLVDGGAMRVRLKPGRMKATVTFSEVDAPRRFVCQTSVANGMMTARAVFELTPVDDGAATEVSYTLDMGGPVGVVLRTVNPNKIAKEAQVSLNNLVRLTTPI